MTGVQTCALPISALNVLLNKMDGGMESVTPAEYAAGAAEGCEIVDCGRAPFLEGRRDLGLGSIDGPVEGLGRDDKILLVCNKGKQAYLVQNRLKFYGYTNTKVLEGGAAATEVE